MTVWTLHASGPLEPAEVWERYALPGRWPLWSPQIVDVDVPVDRIRSGAAGRVRGHLGLAVPFVVEEVDENARRWSWRVGPGPARLRLVHWVGPGPAGGTTTGLRIEGAALLVLGYAPLAARALRRLVRPR